MVKASRRSSFRKLWKNLNGRLQRSTYTYSYRMSSWKVRWNHWKIDWIASAIGIHLQTRYTNYKRCTILGQIYKRPRRISCLLWWWLGRGQIWQELYQRLSCLVWWKLISWFPKKQTCVALYTAEAEFVAGTASAQALVNLKGGISVFYQVKTVTLKMGS